MRAAGDRDGHVLVVGESLVDVVTRADGTGVEMPGGSAANVAIALARLGRRVRFATSYADDARGRAIAEHLAASGVELASDPHVLDRTSSAVARVGDDGAADYEFDIAWRLGPVGDESLTAPTAVHVSSIGVVLAPGADDVLSVLDRVTATGEALVSYDINARPAITGTGADIVARVEAVVRRAGLVKASDEDLAAVYPDLAVDEAAAHLRGLGADVVVVTRGDAGATWFGDGGSLDAAAVPATVADTIGAGDTFSAALIDAWWSGLGPAASLEHAGRAAAVTVSRPGADPPWRADLP